jgi:uncharacterized protein YbaR (Trm112 family)
MAVTSRGKVESLLLCPICRREMRLLGIESESATRELYTFECKKCHRLEVRGVRVN